MSKIKPFLVLRKSFVLYTVVYIFILESCYDDEILHVNDVIEKSEIEEAEDLSDTDEENWSDWDSENADINCLFCDYIQNDFEQVLRHMKEDHGFNFEAVTVNCNFYQKVKIVNYARRQRHVKKCIFCDGNFEKLDEHMRQENHHKLPDKEIWDQPEFYFPMYENDSFLYNLDSNCKEDEDSSAEV